MSQVFSPATPLEVLVHRGDYEGTLEHLRPLSVVQRQRHRASVARMIRLMWESGWKHPGDKGPIWDSRSTPQQSRAAAAAILLCGTAEDAREAFLQAADVVALAREFELPALAGLADALLREAPHRIRLVQDLIVAGTIARPESEHYTLGLISLPRHRGRDVGLDDYFAADPGLHHAVLRMFDIQGTAEDCLASSDKYNLPAHTWTTQLLALCRRGALSRATLLDKSLAALEQDWPQYRAGWFSRFHQALEPTPAELRERTARYLQLCHSRIPPTVSLALEALAGIDAAGALPASALLEALRPVLATGSKGQVEVALRLAERCRGREPALGAEAATMACAALVHEAPALQAKVLKFIAPHAAEAGVREALQRHAAGIAPSNRAALLGHLGETTDRPAPVDAAVEKAGGESACATSDERRLEPVRDDDDLVQLVAHVFENDTDIDAFERALGALVAAAPVAAAALPRFAPVLKRMPRLRTSVARELARLLAFVCQGARVPSAPSVDGWGRASRVHEQLARRVDDLIELAALGHGLPPLSMPTHRRGVIAPAELVSRLEAYGQRVADVPVREQSLAILRLDPAAADSARRELQALPDRPFVRALRYALGEDIEPGEQRELFCAAARIRHPGADDTALARAYGDLGPDGPLAARYGWEVNSWTSGERVVYHHHDLVVRVAGQLPEPSELLAVARHPPVPKKQEWGSYRWRFLAGADAALVAYSATVLPSDTEAFFAEGARELGNNLDWAEARWHNKAYLEVLLDATVRPGPMACLMLACALAGKEPGQAALAVDCLVRLHADGRLESGLLAGTFGRLLATPLVKAARWRKSFDAARRIDPGFDGVLVDLLVPALATSAESPPKDVAALLELLHELLLASGRRLDDDARARLAAMRVGGSGKTIQKKLLALGLTA